MTHKSIFAKNQRQGFLPAAVLQLVVNYIVVYDFCGFVADIIHSSDPLHLVIRFEFFCHALTLCHLIYEPKNHNRICGMIAKKVRMWYDDKTKTPENPVISRLSGVIYFIPTQSSQGLWGLNRKGLCLPPVPLPKFCP